MRTVGIIAEYNPFHNGHKLHVEKAKAATNCEFALAVISGNFVQRGEPAIFNKWERAAMAVENGVDLVLELPYVYSVSSAQYFAEGAIQLLSKLNIISHVCFGAECADLEILSQAASAADKVNENSLFRENLKAGSTYAAAMAKAMSNGYHSLSKDIVSSPNNILAIEYLRALNKFSSNIIPVPINRESAHYHDPEISGYIASATAIRNSLTERTSLTDTAKIAIPSAVASRIANLISAGQGPVTLNVFENIILAKLRIMNLDEVKKLPGVSEGLHYKLINAAQKSCNIQELLQILKTKRYPQSRLQRILIHVLLSTNKADLDYYNITGPLYARVLAFNKHGQNLLKTISRYSALPIITKVTHFLNSKDRDYNTYPLSDLQRMLSLDTLATDIYSLGIPKTSFRLGASDFLRSPIYIL